MDPQINRTLKNLAINGFETHLVETVQEAKELLLSFLEKNTSVGYGGSLTLEETGILDEMRNSTDYELYDRVNATLENEKNRVQHDCLSADYFLTGANGITEDGKIVNIDYRGNRVAALTYGPDKVFIVVGINKISKNVEESYLRIKNIAVKKNAKRLNWKTPCIDKDKCIDCKSDKRMCGVMTVHEFQTIKDRISIILINQELGF